ncbi:MAG: glycoside hydrolase family 2 protein, partial [Lachnospiraceae bacterium]|nr:glycoside hydrolase family 2 protein [Lachnospiraceae bacterium]
MIEKIYLNDNWSFYPEGEQATTVRIPHTVKEIPFHYFSEKLYQMVSFYERDIEIKEEWLDKALVLEVGAAAHDAVLFINDKEILQHHTGYTAFSADIAPYVHAGANKVKIKVDSRESLNVPPFGLVIDYLTYGGIYRDVTLTVKDKAHFTDSFVYSI